MKSREPFALAAICEARAIQSPARWWARSASSPQTPISWCRHPRPNGRDPTADDRWLANIEPNPRDLLVPFPAEPMMMVADLDTGEQADNDDPSILEPFEPGAGSTPNLL
jgi:hypothetical protein